MYSCRVIWCSRHYIGRNLDSRTTTLDDHASQWIYNSQITAVFHEFSRFTLYFSVNSRIKRNPFQTLGKLTAGIRYRGVCFTKVINLSYCFRCEMRKWIIRGCLLASSRFYYLHCFDSPLLLCYVSISVTEELKGEDFVFINLLVGCF